MARSRPAGEPEVYSITGAQTPHSDDLDQRISRYLVSMGIRTACVVLVIVVQGPLRWVFAVGAIVLPYVAVVLANNAGPRRQAPTAVVGDLRRRPRQITVEPAEGPVEGRVVPGEQAPSAQSGSDPVPRPTPSAPPPAPPPGPQAAPQATSQAAPRAASAAPRAASAAPPAASPPPQRAPTRDARPPAA